MESSSSDEETVVLELQGCPSTKSDITPEEISISAAEISSWNLPLILSSQIVRIQVNRNRLIQQSSYFRCLFQGNFSDSRLNHVPVQWNLETVIKVVQFIYGCPLDITCVNFLPILEGALFFGVESLLLECETSFRRTLSVRGVGSLQISLDALIELWNFGSNHAIDFIPELCKGYLARNFVWAMSCNSFINVPYDFLCSCIEHPHLTVDSEKQLCEALLVWLTNNGDSSQWSLGSTGNCYTDILKKVRICFLPLSFIAGKRRNRFFSEFADKSISTIFDLIKDQYMSLPHRMPDFMFDDCRIRLTEYSERIDLSGCIHIRASLLFLSLISSSCNMDTSWRKRVYEYLIEFEHPKCNWSLVPLEFSLSFEAVRELDISKSPGLHLDAVIKCISMAFPSLKILKASHCLHFKMKTLCDLVQKCPQINEVDLTLDISSVMPTRVTVISTSTEEYQGLDNASCRLWKERLLSSNIVKLTLEGRADIVDLDLQIISALSSSLSYLNLKGCTSVTDVGISQLVSKCMNLCSLVVSDTDFGRNSVLALCSDFPFPSGFPRVHHNPKCSSTLAFRLQQLNICGCKSVSLTSLSHLMSHTYSLKNLSLRETPLVDDVLYDFLGSCLEYLDVSQTMVSKMGLAYTVQRNPGLTVLKARGCKNLHGYQNDSEMSKFPSKVLLKSNGSDGEELFHELSQTCILKEMEFGWGFTPFSLEILGTSIRTLRAVTLGLGASLGEHAFTKLSEICPLLEELVLNFQVISDSIVRSIMSSLRNLQVLGLCYCLGNFTSLSFQISMPNLTTLRLERVTQWMTNDDLIILTRNCSTLHELSLTGCKLLDSDSQEIISSGWPGLRSLHLEDCGKVTCNGVSSILECKALEDLLLRHNGPGIQKNFIEDAASKLLLLRKISLDLCDASEGGFYTPSSANRFFLSSVKMACCESWRCAFELQNSEARRMVHNKTIVLEWYSKELRTTIVRERV